MQSLDDEVAMKLLPTKQLAGQCSSDELFSTPAKRVTLPLQESTANAHDLESTSKELPPSPGFETNFFSTTGTKLEGRSGVKSYNIGEVLASEEASDVAFTTWRRQKVQR